MQSDYIRPSFCTHVLSPRVKGLNATSLNHKGYRRQQYVQLGKSIQRVTVSAIGWNSKGKVVGQVKDGKTIIDVVKIGEHRDPHKDRNYGLWAQITA